MKKQGIIIILFTIIACLSLVFVSSKLSVENGFYYVEQDLKEGWNLIAGISFAEEVHSESDLELAHIWKAYYYDSKTKQDVEIRPDYKAGNIDPLLLYSNAFWVFVIRDGKIKYKVSPSFANKSRIGGYYQFYSGKNLIAVNDEMYGKSLDELKGDCEILEGRFWDAEKQNWTFIDLNQKLDFESRDKLIGKGISVQVAGDCGFMNGENVIFKGEITIITSKNRYNLGEKIRLR